MSTSDCWLKCDNVAKHVTLQYFAMNYPSDCMLVSPYLRDIDVDYELAVERCFLVSSYSTRLYSDRTPSVFEASLSCEAGSSPILLQGSVVLNSRLCNITVNSKN